MSLLEALSAPGDYTRGVLSGQPGERVRGSDVFPGEAGPATATNILSDPVNWIGLGLAAALMGGAGAKAYQRAARWSDMGRRDFMGAMGGLGAKLMLPIPKATPEEQMLAALKQFFKKDISRHEGHISILRKAAEGLEQTPDYQPRGPWRQVHDKWARDYISKHKPEWATDGSDPRHGFLMDITDTDDIMEEIVHDSKWALGELDKRGLDIVRNKKELRDLLMARGDWEQMVDRGPLAEYEELARMGLGRMVDEDTLEYADDLPLNPQGVMEMMQRHMGIMEDDEVASARMLIQDLAERNQSKQGRGLSRAMRNARDVAAGKSVERHVPRSTYPLLGALGGYNLLANVELE